MSSNLIGRVLLNQYRVDAFVAAGGMGTVYRVWDQKRSVPVAMKVLHADLAEDTSILKRFKREANALKKLTHPNIVAFYGLEQTADFAFLLERYIDGPSLKDVLRRQRGAPLPFQDALIYLKALSAALGYAHVHRVVHCDVKPGNLMIDRGGNIYLTDFGIARHADSSTTTLGAAGTPAYMAPEQIRGEPVIPATDVYALGVIAFELLTGQRPFKGGESGTESGGQTVAERIRYEHLSHEPPHPRSLNPAISEAVAAVMLRSLAKEPGARYANAQDFMAALCAAFGVDLAEITERVPAEGLPGIQTPGIPPTPTPGGGRGTSPEPPTPGGVDNFRRNRTGLMILGAGVIVVIVFILAMLNGGNSGDGSGATAVSAGGAEQGNTEPVEVAVKPSNTPRVTPTKVPTRAPTHTSTPRATPTDRPAPTANVLKGYDLAFASNRTGIYRIYAADPENINDNLSLPFPEGVYDKAWWPSFCGATVAAEIGYTGDEELGQWIYLLDPAANTALKWEPMSDAGARSHGTPSCSPDGRYIAFSFQLPNAHREIHFANLQTPEDRPGMTIYQGYVTNGASWNRSATALVFQVNSQSPQPGDWPSGWHIGYARFPDGAVEELLIRRSDRGTISEPRYPAFSPDGSQLAFTCLVGDNFHLCLADLNSTQAIVLVPNLATKREGKQLGVPPGTPSWSSDGRWIYYTAYDGRDWDIYRVRSSGGTPENLTSSWSSDEIMPVVKWE